MEGLIIHTSFMVLTLIMMVCITGINCRIVGRCTAVTATDTAQILYSHPQYGMFDYPNDYEACWIINTTQLETVIKLSALKFHVGNTYDSTSDEYGCGYNSVTCTCANDIVIIYDTNYEEIGPYMHKCGSGSFTVYSNSNFVKIRFKTDMKDRYPGFKITYSQVAYANASYNGTIWLRHNFGSTDQTPDLIGVAKVIGIIFGVIVGVVIFFMAIVAVMVLICTCCVQKKAGTGSEDQINYTEDEEGEKSPTLDEKQNQQEAEAQALCTKTAAPDDEITVENEKQEHESEIQVLYTANGSPSCEITPTIHNEDDST